MAEMFKEENGMTIESDFFFIWIPFLSERMEWFKFFVCYGTILGVSRNKLQHANNLQYQQLDLYTMFVVCADNRQRHLATE